MKIVYVAGPFRAANSWLVEQNVRRAEEVGFAWAQSGYCVVVPHTMGRFLDGTISDEYWLEATMVLMRACDTVVMVPGWDRSVGAKAEHAEAKRLGMPIYYERD